MSHSIRHTASWRRGFDLGDLTSGVRSLEDGVMERMAWSIPLAFAGLAVGILVHGAVRGDRAMHVGGTTSMEQNTQVTCCAGRAHGDQVHSDCQLVHLQPGYGIG